MYNRDLELLRGTRLGTLALISGLAQSEADRVPKRGGWTIAAVCDHLVKAEALYRGTVSRLIDLAKEGHRAVISDGFNQVDTSVLHIPKPVLPMLEVPMTMFNMFVPDFVREAMTEFRVFPAQAPRIAVPEFGRDIRVLSTELRDSFNATKAVLDANPNLDYSRMRYRHPMMGDNHVMEILRIVAYHERRHQSQIRDILAERARSSAA